MNTIRAHYDVLIIDGEYLPDKDIQALYKAANVDVADEHVCLPEFRGMVLDGNAENYRAVEGKYKGINYYAIWLQSSEKVYYMFKQGAVTASYCNVGITSMPTHEDVEAEIDKRSK
ncbi:hypothetical protein [Methanococcoides seepicolus]|uniref:hypothetical protein n=1 Tax=Methanococcoides seepicolus TaxID=2828780 RepID=UPI0020327A63|nr:hypothetical protein [Methanococcoides seepicolus]